MVPTQLMCTHNHTTVGQYTTPTDEISQPNPRGTRAHAPLLPRGGEGGRAVLEPLFSQEGFCFWDIGKPPPGRCYLSRASVRACERTLFCAHHHHHPRGGREEEEAGHQQHNSQPTTRRRRRRRTTPTAPPTTTTTTRWLPLLALSFLLGF